MKAVDEGIWDESSSSPKSIRPGKDNASFHDQPEVDIEPALTYYRLHLLFVLHSSRDPNCHISDKYKLRLVLNIRYQNGALQVVPVMGETPQLLPDEPFE